ncbi:hypothetical protein AB3G45_19675 [Shinella sp. S4-D37]|uniref:hypothetical protein n=1 Tax=Shinella sp. S4-D37 TaxID=3161999 RepID=UPI0034667805
MEQIADGFNELGVSLAAVRLFMVLSEREYEDGIERDDPTYEEFVRITPDIADLALLDDEPYQADCPVTNSRFVITYHRVAHVVEIANQTATGSVIISLGQSTMDDNGDEDKNHRFRTHTRGDTTDFHRFLVQLRLIQTDKDDEPFEGFRVHVHAEQTPLVQADVIA